MVAPVVLSASFLMARTVSAMTACLLAGIALVLMVVSVHSD